MVKTRLKKLTENTWVPPGISYTPPSFWSGFISISGIHRRRIRLAKESGWEEDLAAISRDFSVVGQDLRSAASRFGVEMSHGSK